MTIDERLEFLVQSTESLHQAVAEAHERMREMDEAERRLRAALLKGVTEFLIALGGEEEEGEDPQ